METVEVTTFIDEQAIRWKVAGDFAWGEGGALYDPEQDALQGFVGEDGFFIATLPEGVAESADLAIRAFLEGYGVTPENYAQTVDEELHGRIVGKSRFLKMKDLGWEAHSFCRDLSERVGLDLSPEIPELEGDHVQVRINRPGSTDFNPPHRDGAIVPFRNTMNFWIPIYGCNEKTRLPVAPGSHLVAESSCFQTPPGNAQIGGKTYNVPAIVRTREGDWRMVRPPVEFGEMLCFTPFLVHGVGINQSDGLRVALELRLTVDSQNYPKRG